MCRELAAAYVRYRLVPSRRASRAEGSGGTDHSVVVEHDLTVGSEPGVGLQTAGAAVDRLAKRRECVVRPVRATPAMRKDEPESAGHVGSR